MPRCLDASGSVRAPSQYQSAKWAEVVQIFRPLSTHPSPSRTAFSAIAAASDPAWGSEYPIANSISPRMIRGRKYCFRVSLPWRMIVLPTIPTPLPGCGQPYRESPSVRTKS